MSGKTWRHRIEHTGFRVLSAGLLALPERLALGVGEVLGWLAGSVLRIRRADVDAHLALAFPGESSTWRRRVARASYVHLGREGVAMFRLARLDKEAVVARTEVVGLEPVEAAVRAGTGALVVTGHIGNWEIGAAALAARGFPFDVVAKGMANEAFEKDLIAARERLGLRVVDMSAAPREVLRSLKVGRLVGLVADQNAGSRGVFVPFFGRVAATARGPALFALRTGAPIFLGLSLRLPGSEARYRVTLRPLPVQATDDLDADVTRVTAAHTAALEEAVRAVPEQYFWQHRRWKTRPPEEPPRKAPV
ncbi:MAG: lysophospholipid acyltransferase family protein [Gemmatimonadetes bacterium]|nr:lysophospholipid acyltransferase family protein [Gemmatimonadota bacterium]